MLRYDFLVLFDCFSSFGYVSEIIESFLISCPLFYCWLCPHSCIQLLCVCASGSLLTWGFCGCLGETMWPTCCWAVSCIEVSLICSWSFCPSLKNVKLSAEVEPFVPQKKTPDPFLIPMALPGDGGGVAGVEPTPIPSYLITCYPFVQENQSNR